MILGRDAALEPSLDAARRFVFDGQGPRQVLYLKPTGEFKYENSLYPPYTRAEGFGVLFKLCGLAFIVDCTPGQVSLPSLRAQLKATRGDRDWSWVPAES